MKNLLALLLFVPSLCLAQSVTLPYNPDANADSAIGAPDLLEMLPLFGGYFTPDPILIDGMEINEYLNMIEENGSSTLIEGSEHGQMLYWNGEEWVLVSVGENGQFLGLIDNTPVWQDLPTGAGVPEVGCADQTACNYDSGASVNWAPLCVYEDECGVCDGPGAIYECGCADLPEGDCDCDGNQLDALNICGGNCAADVDGDGICDDGDDCIGQADECGVCNGPGAIYECGCSEPDPAACDCDGNMLDAVGVCGGGCTEDADGDSICDTEDDCVGEYDFCGVCNGPGPILGCGCEDIPDGYCDCNGNVLDAVGTCGGACQNDFNGDGICDDDSIPGCTYEVACNYDPSASINDGSCDFTSCYGCTDPAACNYSPAATLDNGTCWYPEGSYDCDYNCLIDTDGDGICDGLEIFGCTLEDACNFDPGATELDDSCQYLDECGECGGTGTLGCTDSTACNFNPEAACDDGSCATDGELGCLDEEACNFNPDAICSDGSCTYPGCNNPLADNYDESAGCDDGSCIVYGCTVDLACNFEPAATTDDNSCEFGTCPGCNDPLDFGYNPTSTNDSLCGTTIQLTNCGAEGRFGPSQQQCDSQYGVGLISCTDGIQSWIVTKTGTYTIEARGAWGGRPNLTVNNPETLTCSDPSIYDCIRGEGAVARGAFYLSEGDTVMVVVGQEGGINGSGNWANGGGSGGGGTFVWIKGAFTPLLAAGGGGGSSILNINESGDYEYQYCWGRDASHQEDGLPSWSMIPNNGSNGSDGTDGDASKGWTTMRLSLNFSGAVSNGYGDSCGFGGGGNGLGVHGAGGGGGYSGGGNASIGSNWNGFVNQTRYGGGGGGSYIAPSAGNSAVFLEEGNSGNGLVNIQLTGL